jgi:hypothetical protein
MRPSPPVAPLLRSQYDAEVVRYAVRSHTITSPSPSTTTPPHRLPLMQPGPKGVSHAARIGGINPRRNCMPLLWVVCTGWCGCRLLDQRDAVLGLLDSDSFCTEPSITLKSGGRRPSRSSLPYRPSVRWGSNLLSRASPRTMSPRLPPTASITAPKRKNSTIGPVSVRSSPPVRSAILQRYLP